METDQAPRAVPWHTEGCDWVVQDGAQAMAQQLPAHLPPGSSDQDRFVTHWRTDGGWFLWVPGPTGLQLGVLVWPDWPRPGQIAAVHRGSAFIAPEVLSTPVALHWEGLHGGGLAARPTALAHRLEGVGLVSLVGPEDFSVTVPSLVHTRPVAWEGRSRIAVHLSGILVRASGAEGLWRDEDEREIAWSRLPRGRVRGVTGWARPGPEGRTRVVGVQPTDQSLTSLLRLDRMRATTRLGERLRSL